MPRAPRQRTSSPRARPYPTALGRGERKQRSSTPVIMNTECLVEREHTKDTVHPYIREDVKTAKPVPLKVWVRAVLGLSEEKFTGWVQRITDMEWHKDEAIDKAMIEFASGALETDRYEPYAIIANRIFELAKRDLPGVESYPINDIEMIRNDPNYLNRIPEQEDIGACRKPDLLVVRGSKIRQLAPTEPMAFDWSDVLTFLEMKRINEILPRLLAWRTTRGLPELNQRTLLPLDSSRIEKKAPPAKPPAASTRVLRTRQPAEPATRPKRAHEPEPCNESGDAKRPRSSNTVTMEAKLQAGGYALEIASCTYGTRLFSTGIIMEDERTSFWYYDAAGVVRSQETLSFFDDFEQIAAILVAFACCGPSQWGILPPTIIVPPSSSYYPKNFPPKTLKDHTLEMTLPKTKVKVRITLQDPIFTQYSLVGRRTVLYAIKTNSRKHKKPMVAKFSYQVTTRHREQDFVEVARKKKVGHLPEIFMWKDFWKMSEGVRAIFHDAKDKGYEDRVFRGIVYAQYFPLRQLFSKSCELVPLMVDQMLDCLHDLRYKAKILHRDISCNNVMYEMRGIYVNFVLIDYDNSTFVDDNGVPASPTASSRHRTGTLPFMAYDLLKDMANRGKGTYHSVTHMLRHDYESLYYLGVYSMVTYPPVPPGTKRVLYRDSVWGWESGTMAQIAAFKGMLCRRPAEVRDDLLLPAVCERFRPWIVRFCKVFKQANRALDDVEDNADEDDEDSEEEEEDVDDDDRVKLNDSAVSFDYETLGGILTRDNIKKALGKKFLKLQSTLQDGEEPAVAKTSGTSKRPKRQEAGVDAHEPGSTGASDSEATKVPTTRGRTKKVAMSKAIEAKKAAVTKESTRGKKTATIKVGTANKIAAAKKRMPPSKTAASNAEVTVVSRRTKVQGVALRGVVTRSMAKTQIAR